MPAKVQTYKNHARFHIPFHVGISLGLLIALVLSVYELVKYPSALTVAFLILVLVNWDMAFLSRIYPLKVQDRVIRLEERLRMRALLPAAMQSSIERFTESQLIALRFASDGELAELAERTLRENLDAKSIKQAIKQWRPDYWRV